MADITPIDTKLPALFAVPKPRLNLLGSGLARAIEPKLLPSFNDGDAGGAGLREEPFKPPEHVPSDWLEGARAFIDDHNAKDKPACDVPGGMRVLKQWVLELTGGYPHGMPMDALKLRCNALAETIEDFPLWCFTKESRRRAAQTFNFVPSTKELYDFVKTVDAEMRAPARKVMAVLDQAARPAKRRDDDEPAHQRHDWTWSREAAEEHGRRLRAAQAKANRELAAQIAAERNEPPVPTRLPGESDYAFMARLKHHRDEVLNAATKVMMRGGSRQTPAQRDAGRLKPNLPKQIAEAMAEQPEDGRTMLQRRAAAMAQAARVELDDGEL